MIYRLAWRNIWRNKLRSGIIMGAIGIGIFAGTFLVALLKGWSACILREHLDMQISCIQIHKNGTEDINDVRNFFPDRKSTRLNSSHANISYAVFCLKKKKEVL